MRGIEFQADVGYFDVLNALFCDVALENYNLYIDESEIFNDLGSLETPSKTDAKFLEKIKLCAPYYVYFINLQCFRKTDVRQKISNYEEFQKSDCQILVLIVDGDCFEIYAKEEYLLLQFITNAIKMNGKNITIKTDCYDTRENFNIWSK